MASQALQCPRQLCKKASDSGDQENTLPMHPNGLMGKAISSCSSMGTLPMHLMCLGGMRAPSCRPNKGVLSMCAVGTRGSVGRALRASHGHTMQDPSNVCRGEAGRHQDQLAAGWHGQGRRGRTPECSACRVAGSVQGAMKRRLAGGRPVAPSRLRALPSRCSRSAGSDAGPQGRGTSIIGKTLSCAPHSNTM